MENEQLLSDIRRNADRAEKYQRKKDALYAMKENCTEENLWNCIVAFQDDLFYTSSGLPFRYSLKTGRDGTYTKELFIDRMENSKSLAWSSVRIAFEKAMEHPDVIFTGPKELAKVRGISYSYSLLWRFGVITVPEEVEVRLKDGVR